MTDSTKDRLAESQAATEKMRKDAQERMKGKPTPTQEENDRAALGEHITEHEADGSGTEQTRHLEARPTSGGYQTRQAAAAHASSAPKEKAEPSR